MGEAKRRGSREQRATEGLRRNKERLVQALGLVSDEGRAHLKTAVQPFLALMSPDEWRTRRLAIVDSMRRHPAGTTLAEAASVRVPDDEMGWYLFLCQQAIDDPLCTDISQSQRALPFFAGMGARWEHASRVQGLERKLRELLTDYRKEPDGVLFEVLVALSYAEAGWDVAFIEEGPGKSPDMHVTRPGQEFFVECKRMARRTQYSEQERTEFFRLWEAGKRVLLSKGKWVWIHATFHVEPTGLPTSFLHDLFEASLPLGRFEKTLIDNELATIRARPIDRAAVQAHLADNWVKENSPMFARLCGGDWAPDNASVTMIASTAVSHTVGCEASVLGGFVDAADFVIGFTRVFDSETSIDKKARDVTKLLSGAVAQVPVDRPSIIHLAAETMEGAAIEIRRSEKVKRRILEFTYGKPVAAVRLHRFLGNQRTNMLFELDETVDTFDNAGADLSHVPTLVVVPNDGPPRPGAHWELYP